MAHKTLELPDIELTPETLVITPNSSVAEALLVHLMEKQSTTSLRSDNILSLPEWLNQQLTENGFQLVASEMQLTFLWEEVIDDMNLSFDMHPPTLAPLALQAWRYLRLWQVPAKELAQAEYGQDVQFNHWCRTFEARLAKSQLCTLEQLAERRLDSGSANPIGEIFLVDFVDPPAPLWLSLMKCMAETVEYLPFSAPRGAIQQYAANDAEQEVKAAVEWVSQCLTHQPDAHLGLIFTQDTKLLGKVESALWLKGVSTRSRQSLRRDGIVEAALKLLKLNALDIELTDARAIIQSPFFGNHPEDLKARAGWEQRLCALESRNLSRSDFFYCARESEELATMRKSLRKQPASLSPIEWADVFQQQLAQLGWPGTTPLSMSQTQAMEEWVELLGELATLGYIHPSMSASKALHSLNRLAVNRMRQTNSSARVHLLDRVEAATGYDYLWLFGCDEESWPGVPSAQPLLPISIQIKYQMPRVSAEQELELSKNLLNSLAHRADKVVCSFAQSNGDQKRRLTPLFTSLPNLELSIPDQSQRPTELEFVDCATAPPLAPDKRQVSGGSRLMQIMAASPFDAFVQYRLNTSPLGTPFEGVSPMQMGQLIHDLLDRFWSGIGSRDSLEEKFHADLDRLISTHIEATLRNWRGARNVGVRQTRLIAARLQELMHEWLPLELERGDFSIVETERTLTLNIGGIALNLRIDRIDQTSAGLLLIDYKSGSSGSVGDWLSSPPTEPQLPLYRFALHEEIAGIAFAKVKQGDMKWVALGQEQLLRRMRIDENWHELGLRWRAELTQLAENFANGDTVVRETDTGFFQTDPLRALHRFSEYEELEKCRLNK